MTFELLGLGTAVPEHSIDQADAAVQAATFCGVADGADGPRLVSTLFRRAGVRSRHSIVLDSSTNGEPATQSFYPPCEFDDDDGPTTGRRMEAYEASAPDLALNAAVEALRDARVSGGDVTHLVTVSCSGFAAPGVDVALCDRLGLPASTSRTNVGFMGCHGALNGLRVASAYARAEPDSCVLLCAVELCTLHYHYGARPQRVVANALFADGAAAVVGRPGAAGRLSWGRLVESRTHLVPETTELMGWRIGDHGFEMSLSPRVSEIIEANLRDWAANWLAEHGLVIDDVDAWAIHPGGPRILDACQTALGLPPEALEPSRDVLARYGNMSSPTVLFVLDEWRRRDLPSGSRCVLLAFGPGLTIESALIEFAPRS